MDTEEVTAKVVNPITRIINTLAQHIRPNLNAGDKDNLDADLSAFNEMAEAAEAEYEASKAEAVEVVNIEKTTDADVTGNT